MNEMTKYWENELNWQFESLLNSGWDGVVEKYDKLLKNETLYKQMLTECAESVIMDDYLWEHINECLTDTINDWIEENA